MKSLECQPCNGGTSQAEGKPMVGIKIEELTSRGFIEVAIMEVETKTPELNIKKQNEAISGIVSSLYKNEFFVVMESGIGVCIRGLKNKTFRVSKVMEE